MIPSTGWSIALRGLSGHDVKEYLARRGIEDAVLVQQVQSATGGLPLAVTLAADMVQQLGVQRFEAAPEWRLAVRSGCSANPPACGAWAGSRWSGPPTTA